MINKKNSGRFFGAVLATTWGTLITFMVQEHWPGLHILPILLIFSALWIGFYFAGIWAIIDRPAELNRKFPISSRELRRRKKEFYDWLTWQDRRH